ncbi:MAG: hypothetical protein ABIY55_08905, partial [Kofleriaceae bacterium]
MPSIDITHTLALAHTQELSGQHNVSLELTEEEDKTHAATVHFRFRRGSLGAARLRWHIEETGWATGRRFDTKLEADLSSLGRTLFDLVFDSTDAGRGLWAALRKHLARARIAVYQENVQEPLPWDLLRAPDLDAPIGLLAGSLVRVGNGISAGGKALPDKVLILLVISRPDGADDIPYSFAGRYIMSGLIEHATQQWQITVLRPPTLARLAQVLVEARTRGEPYSVVHFDGHGVYEDVLAAVSDLAPRDVRGYLLFENPDLHGNREYVDGGSL